VGYGRARGKKFSSLACLGQLTVRIDSPENLAVIERIDSLSSCLLVLRPSDLLLYCASEELQWHTVADLLSRKTMCIPRPTIADLLLCDGRDPREKKKRYDTSRRAETERVSD
jgi:hypothetical protein